MEELDAAAPNNPLQCCTCNGHISTYNSKALEYLGVYGPEDASKYPEGEVVVENGKLTGLVRGHTHFWLWGQVEYTEEQQRKAAMRSHQQLLENGITSIGDMGECDRPSYHIMQKMCRSGEFKVRSYMAVSYTHLNTSSETLLLGLQRGFALLLLRVFHLTPQPEMCVAPHHASQPAIYNLHLVGGIFGRVLRTVNPQIFQGLMVIHADMPAAMHTVNRVVEMCIRDRDY